MLKLLCRHCLKIIKLDLDGDCGRGFFRIENFCVNVSTSTSTAAGTDVTTKCSAIQAGQLASVSTAMSFLIRVRGFLPPTVCLQF